VHWDGKRVQKFRHAWATAIKKAGIECTPHTLRHTRATWLMQNGVDVWEASGHLGMSLQTLMRDYAKHSPNFQKRAAEV
jgi:integrase